jgi:glycosyltransferase involved in cell wall biosynthesis
LRIAIHDHTGHAFPAQLSRELARRGHDVLHAHCTSFRTPRGAVARADDDPPNLVMTGIGLAREFPKYSLLRRPVAELEYGRLMAAELRRFGPDVVISGNTPLLSQLRLENAARAAGAAFVFWQQDILSLAIERGVRARIPRLARPAGAGFRQLERRLVLRSDAVVVISPDFVPVLRSWGVDADRVAVIENWAPLDELPLRPRANPWAAEHDLDQRPVLLYSGTLGLKHDPELLVRLAGRLEETPRAVLVVVAEGPGADWLRTEQSRLGLERLRLLPFQPYDVLPDVLASADVLLTLLEPEAGEFSVPSKVLTNHCAGRALLVAVPEANLAARLVREARTAVAVDPGDSDGFADAALSLLEDDARRSELGARARAFAEERFDISRIGDEFEELFTRVARPVRAVETAGYA